MCWVLTCVVEFPSHELVPVTDGWVVWFSLYQLIVCLPLELSSGIRACCCVVVLVILCLFVVKILYRSDVVGVVLFVGLQRESKRSSVP